MVVISLLSLRPASQGIGEVCLRDRTRPMNICSYYVYFDDYAARDAMVTSKMIIFTYLFIHKCLHLLILLYLHVDLFVFRDI